VLARSLAPPGAVTRLRERGAFNADAAAIARAERVVTGGQVNDLKAHAFDLLTV
jgi:hypothetical protein